MNVAQLGPTALPTLMQREGLCVQAGPFSFRLKSDVKRVYEAVGVLYADCAVLDRTVFCDFDVTLSYRRGARRWVRPQVQFLFDGAPAFEPVPEGHAVPLLEWAMNWCISGHAHHFLLIHAAVLERNGRAVVFPAPPGSGKSTLCAALMFRGWRLLSDEMALIAPSDGAVWPLARPVGLKNESIELIKVFEPSAVFTAPVKDTAKGTVAHFRVPSAQVSQSNTPAPVSWIVFPKYHKGQLARLLPKPKAETMFDLTSNAFNYTLLGRQGFDCLCDMVSVADCFSFEYSQLDDAIETFDRLASKEPD